MSGSKRIAHRDLVQFFKDALGAVGVPPHVAQIEAEIGAEVDLCEYIRTGLGCCRRWSNIFAWVEPTARRN